MTRKGSKEQPPESGGNVPSIRADGLQIDEFRPFQETWWTVERIAWCGFALVVIAALLGILGAGGPFSEARQSFGAAAVDYPRVTRWLANDELRVVFGAGGGSRTLTLGTGFAEHFAIDSVQPLPESVVVTEAGHRMAFAFEGGAGGPAVLNIRPSNPGIADYTIAVDDSEPVRLTTIVLP